MTSQQPACPADPHPVDTVISTRGQSEPSCLPPARQQPPSPAANRVADRSRDRGDEEWLDHLQPDDLRQLITTLPVIEQAKGILMGYYGLGPDQAFALLQRWSSTRNIKLRRICRAIIDAAQQPSTDPYSSLRNHLDIDTR